MATPRVTVVPLSSLIADPANVRVHDTRSREAIGASVKELGAARSIVADADGVIRAGNGTLEAARAAGIQEAVVVESDGKRLVVVKRPDWTAEQAIAYAIADNRVGELSYFDTKQLAAVLATMTENAIAAGSSALLDTTGFSEKDLEALLAIPVVAHTRTPAGAETRASDVDPAAAWAGMPGYEHEDKRAFRSIVVHFKDAAALEEFAKRVAVPIPPNARYLWFPEIEIGHYADKTYASEP